MAERGFSSTIKTELSDPTPELALLVYLNWVSSPVYVWTGVGDLSWNSHTWTGVGTLGSIDKVADSVERSDIGIQLTLNYLDDSLRNELVANDPVGRDATIYLAVIPAATKVVADAYAVFTGFIDEISILDGGSAGSIGVRLASELAKLNRPRWFALSDAHQQYLFSGDKGMEFAPLLDQPITWGRRVTQVGTGPNDLPPSNDYSKWVGWGPPLGSGP